MSNRLEQLTTVQDEAKKLFEKKNKDYGDAFANYGPIGVLVRMGDKIQRLQTITNHSVTMVQDEKMRDTLIDLHNYAAMAIMLLDEKKKKKTRVEQLKEEERKPQDTAYLCKVDKMAMAKKSQNKSEAPYPASGYAHRG